MMTFPEAGRASPERILVSVVFPEPLRPTSPILSPDATRKLTSAMSKRAPARTSSWCAVINAGPRSDGWQLDVESLSANPSRSSYELVYATTMTRVDACVMPARRVVLDSAQVPTREVSDSYARQVRRVREPPGP